MTDIIWYFIFCVLFLAAYHYRRMYFEEKKWKNYYREEADRNFKKILESIK